MPADAAYPNALNELIAWLRRLPGIGKRTAERLALELIEWSADDLRRFGGDLAALRERITFCEVCGNLAEQPVCRICRAPDRERDVICVVETPGQIPVLEAAGCYRGLYHVLGGRIVPLDGRGPEDLRVAELRQRLEQGDVRELILALSSDVEGEATASYLAAEFEALPVRITRIAAGVPVGADLSYADPATLSMALAGRRPLQH